MSRLVLCFMISCVSRDPVSPVYQYDYTDARFYDCPHAPDTTDPRCEEGPKKDSPYRANP